MVFRALKFAICVTMLTTGTLAFSETEDGLCVIFTSHARGKGFIVGDKVFSAAHVLTGVETGRTIQILCSRKGRLVDISSLVFPKPHIHPRYFDLPEGIDVVNARSGHFHKLGMQHALAYDIAYLNLSENVPTNFILDPSSNIDVSAQMQERIGVTSDTFVVNSQTRTARDQTLKIKKTTHDLFAINWRFNVEHQKFQVVAGLGADTADLYMTAGNEVLSGDSGGPLYLKAKNGERVVLGIAVGNHNEPVRLVEDLIPGTPSIFAPAKNIVSWLKEPSLFSTCLTELHDEKSAHEKRNL